MKIITSIKDPEAVLARALTTAAGRREHGKVLLFGEEQIRWAVAAGLVVDFIIHSLGTVVDEDFADIPQFEASEGILKKITETNYLNPLVAVANPLHGDPLDAEFVVVFDDVVDFGNIGTIIRTAQSFGIDDFIATPETFDPYQRKVIDASRGSVFSSRFKKCPTPADVAAMLKKAGYQIVVTSPHARFLQSQTPLAKKPIALVVGNESHGISDELLEQADVAIQIPMQPAIESLNVGVAAGISLYELTFKMVLVMLTEKITNAVGRQVNVTGKLIQMVFDKRVKAVTGLSGMQAILLMILQMDKSMSAQQIARDVAASSAADLALFLKPLLERGFIVIDNESFVMTEEGRRFLGEIWPIVEKTNEEVLAPLSQEERTQLHMMLGRIQAACEQVLKG